MGEFGPTTSHGHSELLLETVNRFEPGTRLRIQSENDGMVNGRFVGLDKARLILRNGDEMALPLDEIDQVWKRNEPKRGGLLLGGAIGGVVVWGSITILANIGGFGQEEVKPSDTWEWFPAGFVIGATTAALVSSRWRQQYP